MMTTDDPTVRAAALVGVRAVLERGPIRGLFELGKLLGRDVDEEPVLLCSIVYLNGLMNDYDLDLDWLAESARNVELYVNRREPIVYACSLVVALRNGGGPVMWMLLDEAAKTLALAELQIVLWVQIALIVDGQPGGREWLATQQASLSADTLSDEVQQFVDFMDEFGD